MQPRQAVWLDANISPSIALWLNNNFEVECKSCFILGLHREKDISIYRRAKEENVIFITKDKDFAELQLIHKSPPKIILLTSGNVSNVILKEILNRVFRMHFNYCANRVMRSFMSLKSYKKCPPRL